MSCLVKQIWLIMWIDQCSMLGQLEIIVLFGKLCEEWFNKGFPVGSVNGALVAHKVHFTHPTVDTHPERVQPNNCSMFSSSDLVATLKEI
jgi:hypothetical protein